MFLTKRFVSAAKKIKSPSFKHGTMEKLGLSWGRPEVCPRLLLLKYWVNRAFLSVSRMAEEECILKKSSYSWHSGIFVAIHSDLNPRLASGPGPEIYFAPRWGDATKKSISPQKSREFVLSFVLLIKFYNFGTAGNYLHFLFFSINQKKWNLFCAYNIIGPGIQMLAHNNFSRHLYYWTLVFFLF